MKNNLKHIGYVLIFMILNHSFISCSEDDLDDAFPPGEDIVENILEDAYMVWNAPKNLVQEQMRAYTLIDSDSDFLQYADKNQVIKLSYSFIRDSLRATVAIAPKLSANILDDNLDGYENLGELSSKNVYHNASKNTMCFAYDIISGETEYSVMGFTPIVSTLFDGDIIIKVDYENLSYAIDGKSYKMILVDGGDLPAFYMMQTEVPLSKEIQIGNTTVGPIDDNGDNCIIKSELRTFIKYLNAATGLDFRLPTETEWKFAANGGVNSNNYTYSGSNNIDDVAWYSGNCDGLQDVALKQPNELGFYDMSGNYAEVCSVEPLNIDGRTFGGCWKYGASQCTTTSCQSGNTSTSKIPGTSIREKNAVDGRYITVRLVYSAP